MTRFAVVAAFSILAMVSAGAELSAEPVAVSKPEGIVHGFLRLRSLEGDLLATGDLIQLPNRGKIESRLVFHFLDGSTHDERVVFSQKNLFRLESYHLVQKGPSFPEPIEVDLDRARKHYRVYHGPANGEDAKTSEGEIEIPLDAYNGMFFTILKSLDAHISEEAKRKVSMVVFTPEPRVVGLEISSQGEDPFTIEGSPHRAVHYVLTIEVGGLTGVLADLLGKNPPPLHTWMIRGDAPTFVKFQGFLFRKGPIWSIELASPSWPDERRKTSSR